MKNLAGPSPKQASAEKKAREKEQSPPEFPIVKVTDLSKSAGDTVSVDLFNIVQGKPVMGDGLIQGKLMSLSSSSMDITINQYRGGVSPGGKMTQQRTVHNLRSLSKAYLSGWMSRLEDQIKLVHLAGARGQEETPDWVIPLDTDTDFSSILVNSVVAPTYNRHYYAGSASGLDSLTTADFLKLEDISKLRAAMDEAAFPMQGVKLPGDPSAEEDPLYVLLVSPRQWYWLKNQTGPASLRQFQAQARERSAKNPLFTGDVGLWDGILVKKMTRSIRWAASESVTVADTTDVFSTTTATTAVVTDRAILLGAQALADVYGKSKGSDFYYDFFERMVAEDHDNTYECSVSSMGGKSKIRFLGSDGKTTDHGVAVMDSYAPDPNA